MSIKWVNRDHQQENIFIYQQRFFQYRLIIHINLVLGNQHTIVNIVAWSAHREPNVVCEKGPYFIQICAKPENFKLNRLILR